MFLFSSSFSTPVNLDNCKRRSNNINLSLGTFVQCCQNRRTNSPGVSVRCASNMCQSVRVWRHITKCYTSPCHVASATRKRNTLHFIRTHTAHKDNVAKLLQHNLHCDCHSESYFGNLKVHCTLSEILPLCGHCGIREILFHCFQKTLREYNQI